MQLKPTRIDDLNRMIAETRRTCNNPNSCPSILHDMLKTWKQWSDDVVEEVLHPGLSDKIRRFLKAEEEKNPDALLKLGQVDMWHPSLRSIIKDIDRARVFVPSRGEFIPLIPECINRVEAHEAGTYLVGKGEECIRVGEQLIALSKAWRR
jgi:hypothetical protein